MNNKFHIGTCTKCGTSGLHVGHGRDICWNCYDEERCTCPAMCEVHEDVEDPAPAIRDRDALWCAAILSTLDSRAVEKVLHQVNTMREAQ